ncbi:phosphate regulon transcriptional regulatory protein PhoB [Anaeromyxobacter sp. PSR-1]|nr:phosphate regulon transcriptional regulatory protein PhoB [Anaeromyxobacter sp. PSR-1]
MGASGSRAGLRIVVIDDDADLRELLVEVLRRMGHAVIGLPAQAGVFQLADLPPADVWVVDHRLPGRLGGEVIRAVHDAPSRHHPVLVGMSGDEHAEEAFRRAGADVFLRKPFEPARLVAAIEAALARRRAAS